MMYSMVVEFYPPYIYYIAVFVILFLLSFLKKKKGITPWNYKDLLYLFGALAFLLGGLSYFLRDIKEVSLWRTITFQILYLLPLIWIFFLKGKRKLRDFYLIVHNEKDIFLGFGIGIIFAGLSIVNILINKESILSNAEMFVGNGIPFFYIDLLFVGFIGPLTEEIIFRGILIPSLAEKMETRFALLFSIIVFALFHGTLFLTTGVMIWGFVLGLLFVKRKTIIPGFIVHLMGNLAYYITLQLVLLREI
ncbi:CPBP family intramembrane metalloprotease [candidate division WOR-3 bacterium]|nr:CPBP family intramembrane metalloprotease [candidate division WOR-3 bacterium]